MTPDALVTAAIKSQVLLERLKNGQVRDVSRAIAAAEAELVSILKRLDVGQVGELKVREFNRLLEELRAAEERYLTPAVDTFGANMEDLADMEAEQEARSIGRLLGNDLTIPEANKLYKAVLANPISATGELLQPFVDSITPNQLKKTEAMMRRAHTEGWTVQQAVQKLRGTAAKGFKDGITALKTRQAEAVVRTSLQHASNAARQETWAKNADVIDGYQWLSTLDGKTTPQCQALDGQKFKLGKGPTPPIHINCRSTTVPDLNDGLDFLDKGATRSSLNGPVDAKITYFEWLKKQDREFVVDTLGADRAAMFLDQGLTPEQFRKLSLDKTFRPLSNKDMRAKLEGAGLLGPMEPAPGTKTGQLWAMARQMQGDLGRMPTSGEFLAQSRAAGFNDATAKTQFAAWKKDLTKTPPVVVPKPVVPPTKKLGWDRWDDDEAFAAHLTQDEKDAVQNYTGDGNIVNDPLRRGTTLRKVELDDIEQLDGLFAKAPKVPDDATLYRFVDIDQFEDYAKGGTWIDKGYASTSKSIKGRDAFAGDIDGTLGDGTEGFYELRIQHKGSVLPLAARGSYFKYQDEALLPRGTKFTVTKRVGNVLYVTSEEPDVRPPLNVLTTPTPKPVPPPTPKPLPTPVPPPKPATTTSAVAPRIGMPGKGATRRVWELGDELHAQLGRVPTRGEIIAAGQKEGLNAATISTQYAKWKNAPLDSAAPTKTAVAPKPVTPVAVTKDLTKRNLTGLTTAEKEEAWKLLDKQIDNALTGGITRTVAQVEKEMEAVRAKYPEYGDDRRQWFNHSGGYWRSDTPAYVRARSDAYIKEWRVLQADRLALAGSGSGANKKVLDVLRRPLAERGKLKYTFDEQKMGHVGKTEITTAAEMFEALVHPTFVQRSSNVFMQEMSFKIPPASNDHAVRGFYSSRENTVYITPGKNRGALYTVLHEITHSLEYADSDIARKTRDFLTRRANGEAPKSLSSLVKGSSYGISEVAYEDEFAKRGGDHYMGKEYGKKQHATEIVTMGIERLANDAASFRKQDKDYFDFIVRLLNDL